MDRSKIINEVNKFFQVSELVCDHTYPEWGEDSWRFLDTMLLACLLVIRRDILQAPMIVNTDDHTQRGYRCIMCTAGAKWSGHRFAKAVDAIVVGMTAQEARERIKANAHLLPCPIRLEKDVNWLHFDVMPQDGTDAKVYEFKA